MSTIDPSAEALSAAVTPPIRPAEVLDAQDRMDDQLLSREAEQTGPGMAGLAGRLPRLVPAHPADLTAARQLTDEQLAGRISDATGRLLQLPRSLDHFQEPAQRQQRAARHQAQAAATRTRELHQQLERRSWLRRVLQPRATAQLRQQLQAAEQQRTQAAQQQRAAQVRLQAISDRQEERTLRLAVDRSVLRDGAAAMLVLTERGLARDLTHDRSGDRAGTRHPPDHDRDQQRAASPHGERPDGADREPVTVRSGPERT